MHAGPMRPHGTTPQNAPHPAVQRMCSNAGTAASCACLLSSGDMQCGACSSSSSASSSLINREGNTPTRAHLCMGTAHVMGAYSRGNDRAHACVHGGTCVSVVSAASPQQHDHARTRAGHDMACMSTLSPALILTHLPLRPASLPSLHPPAHICTTHSTHPTLPPPTPHT